MIKNVTRREIKFYIFYSFLISEKYMHWKRHLMLVFWCNRSRDATLSNRLTSALTLFEILKFNEPIWIADYRFSLCEGSREGRDIGRENERERERDVFSLWQASSSENPGRSKASTALVVDDRLFDWTSLIVGVVLSIHLIHKIFHD